MATNFPASLDSLTNPTASDKLNSVTVPHATQHSTLNDAVEALEAKVGVDGSAVTSSHDYILSNGVLPTLNVDSGVLVVDDTNDRVGVNDASPSYALDVTGDINATGDLRISGTAVGAWTTWTPTVTAETGTITTLGSVVGRYCLINDLLEGYIDIPITTNGTGAGQVIFTLPVTPSTVPPGGMIGSLRENAATGTLSSIWYDTTAGRARIQTFAATYPGADGYRLVGHFSYEVA